MIDIISLLSTDSYIICNKKLIKMYGGDCAILVGELCAEYKYYNSVGMLENDFSFYSTQENIEANTGLNPHYQRKALKTLQDAGIITVTKRGLPAKNYYQINTNKLCEIFTTSASSGEGLVLQAVNINNNKQKIIKNKEVVSKDTTSETVEFNFGETEKPKMNLYQKCIALIDAKYSNMSNVRKLLIQYLDLRLDIAKQEGKQLYINQWKGILNDLDEIHRQGFGLEPTIQQSITKGYKSFYPPSSYNNSTSPDSNKAPQQKFNPKTDKVATNPDGTPMVF